MRLPSIRIGIATSNVTDCGKFSALGSRQGPRTSQSSSSSAT
jgi:hypothetical protein